MNLHLKMEEAQPGTEQQTLIRLLNLGSEYFHLYQPLRLLLQLDAEELRRIQDAFASFKPSQIIMLLQLLQMQPFDVLELQNLFTSASSMGDMNMGMELTDSVPRFSPSPLTDNPQPTSRPNTDK
jgi:hypothetical protein